MTKEKRSKFVVSAIGILGIVLFGVGGLLFKSVYVGATGLILMVVYCIIGFVNFFRKKGGD